MTATKILCTFGRCVCVIYPPPSPLQVHHLKFTWDIIENRYSSFPHIHSKYFTHMCVLTVDISIIVCISIKKTIQTNTWIRSLLHLSGQQYLVVWIKLNFDTIEIKCNASGLKSYLFVWENTNIFVNIKLNQIQHRDLWTTQNLANLFVYYSIHLSTWMHEDKIALARVSL